MQPTREVLGPDRDPPSGSRRRALGWLGLGAVAVGLAAFALSGGSSGRPHTPASGEQDALGPAVPGSSGSLSGGTRTRRGIPLPGPLPAAAGPLSTRADAVDFVIDWTRHDVEVRFPVGNTGGVPLRVTAVGESLGGMRLVGRETTGAAVDGVLPAARPLRPFTLLPRASLLVTLRYHVDSCAVPGDRHDVPVLAAPPGRAPQRMLVPLPEGLADVPGVFHEPQWQRGLVHLFCQPPT